MRERDFSAMDGANHILSQLRIRFAILRLGLLLIYQILINTTFLISNNY